MINIPVDSIDFYIGKYEELSPVRDRIQGSCREASGYYDQDFSDTFSAFKDYFLSANNKYIFWLDNLEEFKCFKEKFNKQHICLKALNKKWVDIDNSGTNTKLERIFIYSKEAEKYYKPMIEVFGGRENFIKVEVNVRIARALRRYVDIKKDPSIIVRPNKDIVENAVSKAKQVRNIIEGSGYLNYEFKQLRRELDKLIDFNSDKPRFPYKEKKLHTKIERNEFIRRLYFEFQNIFLFKNQKKYNVPASILLPLTEIIDKDIDERTIYRQLDNIVNKK